MSAQRRGNKTFWRTATLDKSPEVPASSAKRNSEKNENTLVEALAPKRCARKRSAAPIRRSSNSQDNTVQSSCSGREGISVEIDFSSVKEFKRAVSMYLESSDCPIEPSPIVCAAGKAFRRASHGAPKSCGAKKVSLSTLPALSFKSYDDLKSGMSTFLEAAQCPVNPSDIAHESALAYLSNVVIRTNDDLPLYPEDYKKYRGAKKGGDTLDFYNRHFRRNNPRGPHLLYRDELNNFDGRLVRLLDGYCQAHVIKRQLVFPPRYSLRTDAIAWGILSPADQPADARMRASRTVLNRLAGRTHYEAHRKGKERTNEPA